MLQNIHKTQAQLDLQKQLEQTSSDLTTQPSLMILLFSFLNLMIE